MKKKLPPSEPQQRRPWDTSEVAEMVWSKSKLRRPSLPFLTLLAIAHKCGSLGDAWMGLDELCLLLAPRVRKNLRPATRMNDKDIREALEKCVEAGELEILESHGRHATHYHVKLWNPAETPSA